MQFFFLVLVLLHKLFPKISPKFTIEWRDVARFLIRASYFFKVIFPSIGATLGKCASPSQPLVQRANYKSTK